ncbi:MAG: secretion protein [Gammaproteobacteria bacterium]|uniref:secretion protein n=1 Tax=Rhodoferax sp. TaxID=50421 RepID=UPI001841468C|nr:secretion protein [Rhodoferax sp.]MBU3898480.1 secretion protein [Gammaproteobacteria bacterium]MBA3058507.1 secretion protein [Rhodoferax sp.]MBU3997807.1 secretion protein [Gammaproteobacteria bacterium]MBU4079254.1 secretion protein [Gammaproteobacteria bacterium]MBU4112199.1 secretion protein [Gammaproteobacteria bacterium]
MKTTPSTLRLGKLAATLALTLSVAAPTWAQDTTARSFADMVQTIALVPAGLHDSEMLAKVTVAVDFIKRMDLPKAQLAVNEALQLDPRNSHLHFLNGFVYHLQARQGDTQKAEMALEGYQQALRIDPGNWIAQEFQGLAHMDLKQFDQARRAFSEVLLLTPESSVSIYGLMVASYLTGDAKTACAMADQFRKVSVQPPQGFLRSSVSVYASCGNFAQADWMRTALVQRGADGLEVERIDRRLAQWKTFHEKQERNAAGLIKTSLTQAPSNGRPMELAQAFTSPDIPNRPPTNRTPDADPAASGEPTSSAGANPVAAPTATALPATVNTTADSGPRMLLVDVVLLSTQELISTSKGVNLLNALTLQLGSVGGNVAGYSRIISSNAVGSALPSVSTAITRAVTIPALSYSLNIANANSSLNEVLARPTLAAIEGMPSEFFSGTNLSAGVVSTSQQGGTTIVPLDKRFGIKLAVTPNFLPQGRVQLKVEAQRTSLNASADNPRVAYQIEIGETTANANVVMNLGDTLVLSGLSEKSSSSTRDGVPGLQDVPGIQYLFSNKKINDLQRSVLILVTPRAPVQIAESGAGDPMATRMKALRERFGFADSTPANIEAVMTQLQGNDFFREFRQGDVSMERWDRMRSTGDRLKEALGFLYY